MLRYFSFAVGFIIILAILYGVFFKENDGSEFTLQLKGNDVSYVSFKENGGRELTSDEFITKFDNLVGKEPVSVGFDIDYTVLFSASCFYKYTNDYSEKYKKELQNLTEAEKKKAIFNKQAFWDDIGQCDIYSLPKTVAIKLIRFHQKRGDRVYFITARTKPANKYTHILNDYLVKVIGDKTNLNVVIYSDNKAKEIKDNNMAVFYGDADSDIRFAQEAGAKGVRFLRSELGLQYYPSDYNSVGKFNEIILTDSDR